MQPLRRDEPAGKSVGTLEHLRELIDARRCLRIWYGGKEQAGTTGCVLAHVKPEHSMNAEVVNPAFSCGHDPYAYADAAAAGTACAFGNGRKLKAIRNAPRPMPHAPI